MFLLPSVGIFTWGDDPVSSIKHSHVLNRKFAKKCYGCLVVHLSSEVFLEELGKKYKSTTWEALMRWFSDECEKSSVCNGNHPDLIFQMVNKNNAFWSLLVWFKGSGFKYYDPELATFPLVKSNFAEFNIKLGTPVGLQRDGYNCGVLTIAFARLLLDRYKRNGYSLSGIEWKIKSEDELIIPIKKERAKLWKEKGGIGGAFA